MEQKYIEGVFPFLHRGDKVFLMINNYGIDLEMLADEIRESNPNKRVTKKQVMKEALEVAGLEKFIDPEDYEYFYEYLLEDYRQLGYWID